MKTMVYPRIGNIDDVLPHIAGNSAFVVLRRENYTVIDYIVAGPVFQNPDEENITPEEQLGRLVRRECRGIKFDPVTGDIIGRPYHKFKNHEEDEEYSNIDFSQPHDILEKLDGSMVHTRDGRNLYTRKGDSDVATASRRAFTENHQALVDTGEGQKTFIFEFTSPFNQIVVRYEEENLILTGVRDNLSGEYMTLSEMTQLGERFGVPVVGVYADNLDLGEIHADMVSEGVVVRFDDGRMVKVKADEYCRVHGTIDSFARPNRVIEAMLMNTLDDAIPTLTPIVRENVLEYVAYVNERLSAVDALCRAAYAEVVDMDKKARAEHLKNHRYKHLVFSMFHELSPMTPVERITHQAKRFNFSGGHMTDLMENTLGIEYSRFKGIF